MGVDLVGEYVGPSCSIRATVGQGRGSRGLGEENLTWSWIRLADFCLWAGQGPDLSFLGASTLASQGVNWQVKGDTGGLPAPH